MPSFMQNLSDRGKSLLLSAAVHLILIAVFLTIRAGLNLPVEFAEIGFISAASRASAPQTAEIRRETTERQQVQTTVATEPKKLSCRKVSRNRRCKCRNGSLWKKSRSFKKADKPKRIPARSNRRQTRVLNISRWKKPHSLCRTIKHPRTIHPAEPTTR